MVPAASPRRCHSATSALTCLRLSPGRPQAPFTELVRGVRGPRQHVGAVSARGVHAVAAGPPLELEQIPVQGAHRAPTP